MTPKQMAEHASTIRSGFGVGADFDDGPEELDFDDEDAPPIDPDTICECGVEKESDEDRCAICERDRHDAWGSDKYDNAGDR